MPSPTVGCEGATHRNTNSSACPVQLPQQLAGGFPHCWLTRFIQSYLSKVRKNNTILLISSHATRIRLMEDLIMTATQLELQRPAWQWPNGSPSATPNTTTRPTLVTFPRSPDPTLSAPISTSSSTEARLVCIGVMFVLLALTTGFGLAAAGRDASQDNVVRVEQGFLSGVRSATAGVEVLQFKGEGSLGGRLQLCRPFPIAELAVSTCVVRGSRRRADRAAMIQASLSQRLPSGPIALPRRSRLPTGRAF